MTEKMNPDMCSFYYVYKQEDGEEDDYCNGCDGFNKKCEIYTPLKGTQLWKDFVNSDTKRITKEKGECVLWKLTIASDVCKKCKGRSETCLARMNAKEFEAHKEEYEELEREYWENHSGKCD